MMQIIQSVILLTGPMGETTLQSQQHINFQLHLQMKIM